MSRLIMMCGTPGSGKSTFIKTYANTEDVVVSRDEIRFSLVAPDEDYFSKETLVFNTFVNKINEGLAAGKTVWADATHLNPKSRVKLLRMVHPQQLDIIWIKVPLEVSLSQNERRKGTRAYVPPTALINMFNVFNPPSYKEGFNNIFVYENERLRKVLRGV